jgi:hypothetical protein
MFFVHLFNISDMHWQPAVCEKLHMAGLTDPCSSTDKNSVYPVDLLGWASSYFLPVLGVMTDRIWRENA